MEVPIAAYLPEALALAGALLTFLMDAAGVRRRSAIGGLSVVLYSLALLSVLGDLAVFPFTAFATIPSGLVDAGPIGPIQFTSFGILWQVIFLSASLLVAFASLSEGEGEREVPIFYGLLSLATLGMLLVALSADLVFLLLSIEITGISTYVLVAYARKDARALEASMKFYLIGALSTAISFFGASLLYGAYGTTSLSVLSKVPSAGSEMVMVGLGMLVVGLGFKVTAVPFHMWAVDVYDGAPDHVSAFLAAGSKKMGILAFITVFVASVRLFQVSNAWALYVALGALAVVTMTVGNVLALQQRTMKRMLAYSSISQAGYMLIGIAVDTPAALAGTTIQAAAHVLMKGGAFLFVAAMATIGVGNRIDDYRGLGHTHPATAASFAILLLSLAGIPLTLGFVGKFYLFAAAVEAQGMFIFLAIAGLLNSAASVFYYARILRIMYMVDPQPRSAGRWTPAVAHLADPGAGSTPPSHGGAKSAVGGRLLAEIQSLGVARWTAIVLCAAFTIVLGIYPTPLIDLANNAAFHLINNLP
ncbi:MAG: NADH-quinone oxidoreductase subunit N [Euryarchaeota archaeon]|nr:NADH-quinone oxidoreductase subunit N [Euryarchaeota archaeon]MDE1835215.1 NADH-quinone oxidoreductase subunit N [Euryarchaeota archaeon]MDE1880072.1 NADH-quinone oxidoreductase subunit N [Euryarchaeota archaeon]MDE2043511.1 NADH-quinone oxidoreductase subunit N [Thermoplasmata archaeon]